MAIRPSIIVALLACGIIWQVVFQIPFALHPDQNSWGLTDWLVNYSGGFVRRGLAGTLLWWTSAITRIPGHYLAIATSLGCYGVLIYWFLKNTRKQLPPALLLSCVMLGFPAFQHAVIRKDCMLLLFFIACLKLMLSSLSSRIKWGAINLCACCAILTHEAFAFFTIPALAWCHHDAVRGKSVPRTAVLIPCMACFALVTWQHGAHHTAVAIHESWMPLWKQACLSETDYRTPFATIQSIGWSPSEGISMTRGLLDTGIYQPMAWSMVAAISFAIVIAFLRDRDREPTGHPMPPLLIFQLACVAPLFLLGIDYGRWLFLCITSACILHTLGFHAPPPVTQIINHLPIPRLVHARRFLNWIGRQEAILLAFGIPILWSARNFLTSSPLGRLVDAFVSFNSAR